MSDPCPQIRVPSGPSYLDALREGEMNNDLEREIAAALNRASAENASNTPDWILAQFLLGCLAAWNEGVQQREKWLTPAAQEKL